MLLQGEVGRWLRACATALGVAILGCAALASSAGAGVVRHYERVSPAEKGDGDIVGEGEAIVAAKSGDGVTFDSRMLFGDAIGSGVVGRTTYLAKRVNGVWTTHALTPTPSPETNQVFFAKNAVEVFSDDLSTALVWGYDLPAVSDDTPQRMNLYIEDTATRDLRPVSVSQVDPLQPFDFIDAQIWGVSGDAKHLAFVTSTRMLPEAAPGADNVYKWDDGVLTVADTLPDGSVPSAGASVGPKNDRGTMSADGTRLAFTSTADGSDPRQLYLHIDGRRTVWISEPETRAWRDGTDTTKPSEVFFEGMTPDGRSIFFVSSSPLLDEDTASGPDLYRYTESSDPAGDSNLTLITNDGGALNAPGSYGASLVGMSDDGRRAYIHESSGSLLAWDDGVTTLVDTVTRFVDQQQSLALDGSQPGYGRVSPDGTWTAYIKNSQLYLYRLGDPSPTCVSCPADVSLVPSLTNILPFYFVGFRPRFLSDNGRLFFTSTGALVPQDTNGVADVYEYDGPTRTLSLISSGKGRWASNFADASASGDDVFIVTRQQLVPSDRDEYIDLYDVRVGPPTEQPADIAPECEGEACQGAPSIAPADDLLGSLSLQGGEGGGSTRNGLNVKHRVTLHGAAGSLRVRLDTAGRLTWRGKGLVAGSRRGSAGTLVLQLRLDRRARAHLTRSGRYTTTVHLTLAAVDGTRATRSVRVTFRAAAKKGR